MLAAISKTEKAKQIARKGAKQYNSLNKSQKQAVNAGGLIVVAGTAYGAYKLFTGISGAIQTVTGQKWKEERDKEEQKERSDLKQQITKGDEKPILTDSEAKSIAFGLYEGFRNSQPEWSFNLWDEGTNENLVFANLVKIKSKADWLLVAYHYGMPRRRTLVQELLYELNVKEQVKARSILSKAKVYI
jgi:hypothetical protein